jgi:hypothetical protein
MRRIILLPIIALAATFTSLVAPSANAQGDICSRLWVERNSIYKANGYCFKTARAISYFGNAGCLYDSEAALPLSRADRARIASIQGQERSLGCR